MMPTATSHGPHPRSLSQLFWAFTTLALQGFGGVVAIVQRELVEKRRWLTLDEFAEHWAVAQILPGPNVVNISLMLGDRFFGWRGALVAMAGMLAIPLLIVLLLAVLLAQATALPALQDALRGMGVAAAGMIAATGFKLLKSLKTNAMKAPAAYAFSALTFVAVAWLRVPLAWALLGLGVPGIGLAYWRLQRQANGGDGESA
jgi:chromate transporter